MGLAATRVKQRFGRDPRNTNWSNDTSRFGHQQLERFGWKPGMGLGMSPLSSQTSHIKVRIKDDNVGLGAKIARQQRKDEFDNGECAGLDVFQRILGRLNGKEEEIGKELELQRKQKILDGRWGVHFVKADVLASTWDPETKKIKSYSNVKRARDSDDEEKEEKAKKHKKHKKDKKEKKEKKHKKEKKEKKDKKEKKFKTHKDKKEKKEKKHKDKKEKKEKHKHNHSEKKALRLESSTTAANIPAAVTTRLSVRSRWIKQKRAAIMDAKALNEIFMITND